MSLTPQPVPTGYTEGNCSGYTPVSEVFTFNVVEFCNRAGVDQLQLMFKNRYGHYDYFTFQAGKDEGLDIDRKTYKKWSVDWGSDDPLKQAYSRGTIDTNVKITETHVIYTGFLNQPDFMFIEEIYTSNEVYEIQPNGDLRPINILDAQFIRKNKGNKSIVNLELTYAYSNNISLFN